MAKRRHISRKKSDDRRGTVYIVAAVAGFMLLGGVGIYISLNRVETDKETGCPKGVLTNVTAVLIDMTDSIGPVQTASLRNTLVAVRDSIPQYGRLEVYAIGPITLKPLEPIFAGCNPGGPETASNPLIGNVAMAEKNWKKKFADKLDETVVKISQLKPQDSSPIFEGIQSVAVTSFGVPMADNAQRKLVIISDLIQFGPEMSMFHGAPNFKTFQDTQYFAKVRTNLQGANVELIWIPVSTQKNIQTPHFQDFWLKYIDSVNGTVVRWAPL